MTAPVAKVTQSTLSSPPIKDIVLSDVAAKMVGIYNRKEKLAAPVALIPKNRPVAIVIPLRLVPGIKANTWEIPIIRAVLKRM